jgi:hypothetical protein
MTIWMNGWKASRKTTMTSFTICNFLHLRLFVYSFSSPTKKTWNRAKCFVHSRLFMYLCIYIVSQASPINMKLRLWKLVPTNSKPPAATINLGLWPIKSSY